jgi:hypothetical protein
MRGEEAEAYQVSLPDRQRKHCLQMTLQNLQRGATSLGQQRNRQPR